MERAIQIYTSKDNINIVLCELNGSEMSFFGNVNTMSAIAVTPASIASVIQGFLSVSDTAFQSNRCKTEYDLIGYKSFQDMYKKTNLIDLRISASKIFVYAGKKVKRWYEFDPIDPVEGYGIDNDGIKNLSDDLVKMLRPQ